MGMLAGVEPDNRTSCGKHSSEAEASQFVCHVMMMKSGIAPALSVRYSVPIYLSLLPL
tara:strand:+ start:321 stop:494 length:174 start_codon:yes stop_codon:yes gene_type:complete